MVHIRPPARIAAATAVASAALLVAGVAQATATPASHHPLPRVAELQVTGSVPAGNSADPNGGGRHEDDALEIADQAEAYANERTAPAESVPAQAMLAAIRHARQMPVAVAKATEVTTKDYNAEPAGYTDPYWSNVGSGFRDVSGRATSIAIDGSTYYLGTADGGVWKSTNSGKTWRSIWDNEPTLSIGALMIGPKHSLWVGTGEANTNSDSYRGVGVYRSTNGGKSFQRVGGSELLNHQMFALRRDYHGHVYAATSMGLYRHSVSSASGKWQLVFKPEPNPSGSPYQTSFITDVQIRPNTHGQEVLAAVGWRNGDPYNGFYESTTGGGPGSFQELNLTGDLAGTTDIGRTTFGYAKSGKRLYALIQSPSELLAGDDTNLLGVYVSANGDPAGPWTKIADSASLGASGSALQNLPGYHVGVQAWYNEALVVDPKNANHFYVSLEEVFQSNDGGQTFTTASPYWNYGLACGDTCPPVTHPDQHALALTKSGKVVIGNDGGIYQRPMSVTGYGHWQDLNHGLDTLQYYDAAAGKDTKGYSYWGGLQDNGTSVLNPGAKEMIEPAGGDGGMVLVDPNNGKRAVGEYTDLAMYRTQDGGHTFTTISPLCGYYNGSDCDPSARFIAPFTADVHDVNHWVAAGTKVWDSSKGWNTTCGGNSCDWTPVWDFSSHGTGTVGTALAVSGTTTYAAWVAGGGNPGPSFASGIDTNYGGSWHTITSPVLPNRYIQGLTVDPANPAHVFAIYNGYSRRWIPEGGLGTVFESTDGGSTWSNISNNLPDAPGDGLAIAHGKLVLGTDIGMFIANAKGKRVWQRVAGIPDVVVNNVRTVPGTNMVVAGTHGRGIWRVTV